MDLDEHEDRLIDTLLREELGGETPPNLTDRVLRAADAEMAARAASARAVPAAGRRRWAVAALTAALVCVGLLSGLVIAGKLTEGQPDPIPRGTLISTGEQSWRIRLGAKAYCRLEVRPRSTLRVEGKERDEEVYLEVGGVQCEVDRGVGAFAVRTDAGVITAQGTKFSVTMREQEEGTAKGGVEMAGKQMVVRVALGAVLMAGAWGTTTIQAGEEAGTVTGLVVSKGDTWVGIKAEGQEEATMYMPVWNGGLPKDGGGLDKAMLAKIKELVPGSKVKLAWKTIEDPPRIMSLDVLSAPEKKAEVAAATEKPHVVAEGDGEKVAGTGHHKHADTEKPAPPEPEAKKPHADTEKPVADDAGGKQGTVVGVVTAKEEAAILVKEVGKDAAERYKPQWKGGLPAAGGGLDKDQLKLFAKVKIGDWVKIEWMAHEGRRVVKMNIAGSGGN